MKDSAGPEGSLGGVILGFVATIGVLLGLPAMAEFDLDKEGKARIFGDFRFRLEQDWDSQRQSGEMRDDRLRARIRARLGLVYQPTPAITFGIRVRSGSDHNHQSGHITIFDFDGNPTGDADFNFDRWYLRGEKGGLWAWVGRNSNPFWQQDELAWDDDATPAGVAGGWKGSAGEKGELSLILGYFAMPVGMRDFSPNLGAGQLVYERSGESLAFTLAGGFFGYRANPEDPVAGNLLMNNGFRDYRIWIGNAQLRLEAASRPLTLGVDLMKNTEGYSPDDPDPITAANYDQTDGYAFLAWWGEAWGRRSWLVGYYYSYIETFAIHSSYAEDDWVRWGSSTETRASNMKGHELRFSYGFSDKANLVARLFLVDSITTVEDGKRFRVDLNYRF